MLYLLQALILWQLVAAGFGLIVGFFSWNDSVDAENSGGRTSFFPFVLLLATGATVAWLQWLPGRYGLWLETALLLLIAYLAGCALGGLSRGWFSGVAAKAAAETPATAGSFDETTAAPVEMIGEDEALAPSAAMLTAVAPGAPEVFGAAQELLAEADAELEAETPPPLFSPLASAPRPQIAEADDLRLIQGVNADIARRMHDLGVWRFEQFAAWTPQQQEWIGEELYPIGPQDLRLWIAQARLLAGGVETEFARALRQGEARREMTETPLDEAAAAHFLAALPQPIGTHANDEIYAGLRPLALLLPPYGEKDDLCRISGVDAATAQRLNALGIWTYRQIARWSDDNARWIGYYLAVPGRVGAENWIEQARELAKTSEANVNSGEAK